MRTPAPLQGANQPPADEVTDEVIMQTKTNREYRLDVRAANVQVTQARIMVRQVGGEFEEIDYNAITEEVARHIQILAKATVELGKMAAPRFDKAFMIRHVNAAALRRSPTKRPAPKAGISGISPIAKETPRRRRRRR
jgi:hypothetical protein